MKLEMDSPPPRMEVGPPTRFALSTDSAKLLDAMPPEDLESTAALLERIRDGDTQARERLLARYLPILRRWAKGRLPSMARQLADTEDLVQVTLIRVLSRLEAFEVRREGSLLAYLRQAMLNAIRKEIRRSAGRRHEEVDPDLPDKEDSPLERVIGRDMVERYEAALAELPEEQQEAVIMRIEMGFTCPQIAEALGKPTSNAARMVVSRALLRLAKAIKGRP
jgi:RNA polymerase sigma-70 factor (ECF subfamily)